MAQGTAKSALIYGSLATALFITCGVCGTGPSTAPVVMATPVQQERPCLPSIETPAGHEVSQDVQESSQSFPGPACPQLQEASTGG